MIADHGALAVACVALLVRLAALYELSNAPSFHVPIVDEASYDRLARGLTSGHPVDAQYFWQGLFYPLFLATTYAATGGSVLAARVAQAVVGAIGAALAYVLGEQAGGRRIGMAAGLAVAGSGPLIFSDFELVATAWEVLWATSLPLLAMRVAKSPERRWLALLGCVGGLSIVTRASFTPFVVVLDTWLVLGLARQPGPRRAVWTRTSWLLAGLLIVLLPTALVGLRATGEVRVLPYSGGINLYIGNNPDRDATVQIRPGPEWDRLASTPAAHGAVTPRAKEAFFLNLVVDYAKHEPLDFLAGLGKKALEFFSSREIARNLDVYTYRPYSTVLSWTVWRVGRFGFPFGVLFPLALLGLALDGRALSPPLRILLLVYPLTVVAVFATARYRAPVVPALAVAAALGARALWRAVRVAGAASVARLARSERVAWSSALATAGLAASTWPGPFAGERGDHRAEMLTLVATEHLAHGRLDAAEPLLREAIESEPRNKVAHCVLGTLLTQRADFDSATSQFESVIGIDPDDGRAHEGLGNLSILQGNPKLALEHFRKVLEVDGDDAAMLNNVGQLLHVLGDDQGATDYLRRALAVDPTLDLARSNLAEIQRSRGAPSASP